MAIVAHASLLIGLFFLASFCLSPVVLSLTFDYNPVGYGVQSSLTTEGNVSFEAKAVQFTFTDQNSGGKAGRLYNAAPLSLWSASTRQEASFNCSFNFVVWSPPPNSMSGDGLAFILANPSSPHLPVGSEGAWLGLFNSTNNGSAANQIVAVEFDTYLNADFLDPNDNHIGVDVNNIISVKTFDLEFELKSSTSVYAWIDYSSSDHSLDVYASNTSSSKPGVPLFSYPVNLSQYLPGSVLVGFSAATGAVSQIHQLLSWSFNSTDIGPGPGPDKPSVGLIVGIVAGLSILALVVVGVFVARRKYKRGRNSEGASLELASAYGPKKFNYRQLSVATNNFNSKQQLGQGGFGSVYKGILEDGSEVAVKRISQKSKQGEKEFRAEVTIISRIRHRNLVELKGWCHKNADLLLVYEYLPNCSLDHHLFDKRGDVLEWNKRFRIVCELGSALQYLHEECEEVIIHRDVKASNVMLDKRFTAKLGDFGLARQLGEGVLAHTTIAAGTIGYMAPECYGTGKATTESDVFSFGAVLLEVGCGRRPADPSLAPQFEGLLVNWVWSLYGKGQLVEAADATLEGKFDEVELTRMLIVGLACSHPDANSRPTIHKALAILQARAQLPVIPISKPVAYYGPLPPLIADLFSGGSSIPTASSSTTASSSVESMEQSLLHSARG